MKQRLAQLQTNEPSILNEAAHLPRRPGSRLSQGEFWAVCVCGGRGASKVEAILPLCPARSQDIGLNLPDPGSHSSFMWLLRCQQASRVLAAVESVSFVQVTYINEATSRF